MKIKVATGIGAGIVALIAVALLVGNWYVGRKAEKAVSLEIYRQTAGGRAGMSVSYNEISVSPLLRKIKLRDLRLHQEYSETIVRLESLGITCKLTDLVSLARQGELEELHGFRLDLRNLSVVQENVGEAFALDNVALRMDGLISRDLYEKYPEELLRAKRRARLDVDGARAPVLAAGVLPMPSGIVEAVSQADHLSLDVSFIPSEKKLELGELELKSGLVDLRIAGELLLKGEDIEDLKPERAKAIMTLRADPGAQTWPVPIWSREDQLSVAHVDMDARLDWHGLASGEIPMPEANAALSVKDLSLHLTPETRSEFMLRQVSTLAVEEIRLRAECDGEILKVGTAELRSPHMNVDGTLEVDFAGQDPGDGLIREARLRVKDIDAEFTPILISLEEELGMRILDHNRIDLEWRGTLDNPILVRPKSSRR